MLSVQRKSDTELLNDTARLVQRNNTLVAELLVHLQAIEKRRLYAKLGYSSMFDYATKHLHFSEGEAYARIRAARVGERFAALLAAVADGRLHLSGVVVLAPHLTPANFETLLERATHRSKREIERLVAELAPKPAAPMVLRANSDAPRAAATPATVTATPMAGAPPAPSSAPQPQPTPALSANELNPASVASGQPPAAAPRLDVAPRSPGRYRLHLDVSERTRELLDQLRDLKAAAVTDDEVAALLEDALAREVQRRQKQKFATVDDPSVTGKPRRSACTRLSAKPTPRPCTPAPPETPATAALPCAPTQGPTAPSHRPAPAATPEATARPPRPSGQPAAPSTERHRGIPAAVRREVAQRAGFCCSYVSRDGRKCDARGGLEFHHVRPFARGGRHTTENITLRCRAHNALAAVEDFGAAAIDEAIKRRTHGSRDGRPPASPSRPPGCPPDTKRPLKA